MLQFILEFIIKSILAFFFSNYDKTIQNKYYKKRGNKNENL